MFPGFVIFLFTFLLHPMASSGGQPNTFSDIFQNVEESHKVINATTQFALDLYRAISTPDKNVFFSPTSISIALAMTYLGARSQTAAQMREVMKLTSISDEHLHHTFADLVKSLGEPGAKYTLHTANRLYAQEGYNFLDAFIQGTRYMSNNLLLIIISY